MMMQLLYPNKPLCCIVTKKKNVYQNLYSVFLIGEIFSYVFPRKNPSIIVFGNATKIPGENQYSM